METKVSWGLEDSPETKETDTFNQIALTTKRLNRLVGDVVAPELAVGMAQLLEFESV